VRRKFDWILFNLGRTGVTAIAATAYKNLLEYVVIKGEKNNPP